jgi:hypothetical protein
MVKLLELLQQRRIWIAIISVIAFMLDSFQVFHIDNVDLLTDNIMAIVGGVVSIISAVLAIWSYFKPKATK